jgi:hypothetical protein
MLLPVLMPALPAWQGKSKLAKWLRKEGDKVKYGDVLAELETDMRSIEVAAPDDGTLAHILVPAGSRDIAAETPLAVILRKGESSTWLLNYTGGRSVVPIKAKANRACESMDPQHRFRVLLQLSRQLDCGVRDPELLYLGGRYAASLGMQKQACKFLDPLAEFLRDGETVSQAFFPVGLLYLQVLPDGEQREKVKGYLSGLGAASPVLGAVCEITSGGPSRIVEDLKRDRDATAHLVRAGSNGKPAPSPAVKQQPTDVGRTAMHKLVLDATQAYAANDLAAARMALEQLLLKAGDQTGVLRNLLVVAGEQKDIDAYQRYWRRYVKLLLSRLMYGEDAWAAHEELVRFYMMVAIITDRQFGTLAVKQVDQLRTPGLLPRWLEAHAALIWLYCAYQPSRGQQTRLGADKLAVGQLGQLSLMRFWFRAFYPEFLPYVDLGKAATPVPSARQADQTERSSLDPAQKLLTRFAEWSREGFGVHRDKPAGKEEALTHEAHNQAVEALGGCVARIPWQPYIEKLQEALKGNEAQFKNFRDAMQEACTAAISARFDQMWQAEDWKGMSAAYGDDEQLPTLRAIYRMYLAFAHCMSEQESRGFDIALQAIGEFRDEDLRDKADDSDNPPPARGWWNDALSRNIKAALELPPAQQADTLARLKNRLHDALRASRLAHLVRYGDEQIATALERVQTDKAVEQFKKLMEEKKFAAARKIANEISCSSDNLKELKIDMLCRVAVDEAREHISQENFAAARRVVDDLPGSSDKLKELKANLLKQINEEEQIAKAVREVRELLDKDDFAAAKRVINTLPPDMKDFKQTILKQVEREEAKGRAIKRIQELVRSFNFLGARGVVRDLPGGQEYAEFKSNILRQINEAEQDYQMVQAENVRLRRSLGFYKESKINDMVRLNKIDPSNPFQMNQLLKFMQTH